MAIDSDDANKTRVGTLGRSVDTPLDAATLPTTWTTTGPAGNRNALDASISERVINRLLNNMNTELSGAVGATNSFGSRFNDVVGNEAGADQAAFAALGKNLIQAVAELAANGGTGAPDLSDLATVNGQSLASGGNVNTVGRLRPLASPTIDTPYPSGFTTIQLRVDADPNIGIPVFVFRPTHAYDPSQVKLIFNMYSATIANRFNAECILDFRQCGNNFRIVRDNNSWQAAEDYYNYFYMTFGKSIDMRINGGTGIQFFVVHESLSDQAVPMWARTIQQALKYGIEKTNFSSSFNRYFNTLPVGAITTDNVLSQHANYRWRGRANMNTASGTSFAEDAGRMVHPRYVAGRLTPYSNPPQTPIINAGQPRVNVYGPGNRHVLNSLGRFHRRLAYDGVTVGPRYGLPNDNNSGKGWMHMPPLSEATALRPGVVSMRTEGGLGGQHRSIRGSIVRMKFEYYSGTYAFVRVEKYPAFDELPRGLLTRDS